MKDIKFELKASTLERLDDYSLLLKKDHNEILNEALLLYFDVQEKALKEKTIQDENTLTSFKFDEFWDNLDVE